MHNKLHIITQIAGRAVQMSVFALFLLNLLSASVLAQFPISKANYKLPKGITAEDIEQGRVWIQLKPEYASAFQSSNALSRTVSNLAIKSPKQLFPKTEKRKTLLKSKVNKSISGVDISLIYQINLQENVSIFETIDALMATGMVAKAEPVPVNKMYSYTPNDPDIGEQRYLETIKAYEAWDISKGDSTVLVGIIDSGFDFNHPDLRDKVYYNQGDPIDGVDNDNDGYIDNHYGWDFAGATVSADFEFVEDNDPQLPTAGIDHGISVAGCAAAATDNEIGVAGTGFNVKIVATKHSTDDEPGSLAIYNGYQGIIYMAETGVKIINCSWGGNFRSEIAEEIIRSAVEDFGCLVIVAAGNDGQNLGQFPASYDGVLSVGATTVADNVTGFSNYDYSVDITAPGQGIYTTFHTDANGGQYESTSGTSFSSPIVAGAAALAWSHRPELTPIQIGELLRITADPIDEFQSDRYQGKIGHGRLNMERAMTEEPVAVRMRNFEFVKFEEGGIPYAGDVAVFNAEFLNYLYPSQEDFQIKVEAVDNTLSVIDNEVIFEGVINTNQTVRTENEIRLQVNPNLENFGVITLRITYTQDGYKAQEFASVAINPTFITIDKNNITTSVDSRGTIGRHDLVTIGDGFIYENTQTLYELGLMFGTSSSKLSNAVRSTDGNFDSDFRIINPIAPSAVEEEQPDKLAWQTVFNDDGAVRTKLSINTIQTLQLWETEGAEDFVVVEYVFENTTRQDITGFYAGLYGDWDIGDESGNNQVGWNEEMNAALIEGKSSGLPKVAVSVLDLFADKMTYSLISNDENYVGTPYGVYDGFTDREKFDALKGHSTQSIGLREGTDVSATVSAGPYTIPAGEEIIVAFVLAGGNDEATLAAAIDKANELYTPSIQVNDDNDDDDDTEEPLSLEDNELTRGINLFPNPASSQVRVDISQLENNQPVQVSVLNLLGQQLITQTLTEGKTTLDIAALPAGQYILKFNNGQMVGTKTLVVH